MLRKRPETAAQTCICPAARNFAPRVNDPSAGSPTETLLRLLLPLSDKIQVASPPHKCRGSKTFTGSTRSVGATGGVYKGQGRNPRDLMSRAYEVFLVHEGKFQPSIPVTAHVPRVPRSFRPRSPTTLVACASVARVRPRTSKGITDLLSPRTSDALPASVLLGEPLLPCGKGAQTVSRGLAR